MEYLAHVGQQLSIDEVLLLSTLFDNEATIGCTGMRKETLTEKLKDKDFSASILRNALERLQVCCFIGVQRSRREYAYYITNYGIQVLQYLNRRA